MRLPTASAVLAAALVLTPVAAGYAPALSQDFSITNQVEPADAGRRDLMRQLQAWWNVHAYYPRHASNSNEGGTVKIHLRILADGRVWMVSVAESSGSGALDAAAAATFRDGFVRPFPEGAPEANLDVALHYVLAHRADEPVAAGYKPVLSTSPFTIMNDPVKSQTLNAMLLRTCTGTVVRNGIRNHPIYGMRSAAEAIFFRKPDGTPWVKLYEGGYPSLSPVTEVGKALQWVGREEHGARGLTFWTQYTVWPEGDNSLNGKIGLVTSAHMSTSGSYDFTTEDGTAEFSCATEALSSIAWNDWFAQTMISPAGDPP